jgi:hypothetical protein
MRNHALFIFKTVAIFYQILFFSHGVLAMDSANQDSAAGIQSKPLRSYTTTRLTSERPTIDGKLDDACWKTGEWAGDFTQWIPNEGARPSQPTHLKILYDDKNIYVAIRAFDSEPDKISRKAGRRDQFQGDAVGINFDSYHDHRTGFEFNVTASGQKIDLILTNPMNADYNWNAVWYVKVAMEDSAWTAEYEIPLSQLRFSSEHQQIWGMHCWRWIDRLQEESDWELQSSKGPGMLYQFGELHGISGLPKSRRIEIMPYSVGKLNTFKKEPGNPFADKGRSWEGSLGMDAKVGLSSNFTADLTINPDFGQVESDPSVMNLTAFETFYEERRPFFLEGGNIFDFDLDDASLFYSRRIGHSPSYRPSLAANEFLDAPSNTTILSAAKVSGKTSDGLAIGVLQSLTSAENARIGSSAADRDVCVEPMTNFVIARAQKDFKQGNSALGGIFTATNRIIKDSHLENINRKAYTGGVDLFHHWNDKEYYLTAKVIGSTVGGEAVAITSLQNSSAHYYQRPDADHLRFDSTRTQLSGYGGSVGIGKGSKGLWRYSTEITWRSPGLDLNDLGFMQRADDIEQENSLSYFVTQPVSIFRTYNAGVSQRNNWDFGMNHLSSGGEANLYLEFLNKWAISTSVEYTSQALDTRILRGGNAMLMPCIWEYDLYVRTDPSQRVFFDINGSLSQSAHQSKKYYSFVPSISVMPLNILKISLSANYSSNTDELQYIDTKRVGSESRYLLGKIRQHTLGGTFRIDYNVTPEFSIQYYGSPFASVGKYSHFKAATNPRADQFDKRFSLLHPVLAGNTYKVLEEGDPKIGYTFDNPDFDFSQFRSNLVLRWEYRPGSQLFLVWSSEQTRFVQPGRNSVNDAIKRLQNVFPNNIFLVKLNYWFSV